MFDNLVNLIREHAGNAVIDNPAIPNDQNENVIKEAGSSITSGLQGLISQGKLQDVLNLFHSGAANTADSPVVQHISGGFIQNLMDKFGLSSSAASGVAGGLIPGVLQKLVHKTNDPNDSSFDLQGILSHLVGGGAGGGIQDVLGNLSQGGVSGALDKIKGMFGQ